MNVNLTAVIVRILNPNRSTVGAGFLITNDGFIATCAHVVEAAGAGPGDSVTIAFHAAADDEERRARVEPQWWRDPDAEDVAILCLEGPLPADVRPVALGRAKECVGHPFRAFGYPVVGDIEGLWATGEIKGLVRDARGWPMLQLASPEIDRGISGGPVLDETHEQVVGMLTTAYYPNSTTKHRDTAFATPMDTLLQICPGLERALHPPVIPLGKLNNVPDLPLHFLPRPEHLEPLKAALLSGTDKPVVLTGTTRKKVGVQGMGGIGKSVLAAALARDEDVRRAFPSGVLWVMLGQTPALTARQTQIADALEREPHAFTDTQQGRACLSELLADKDCLLILDDVWDAQHVRPFDTLGPRCRMLLTSRNAGLIAALGATECRLDVLDDEQALRLLARWARLDVETLPPEANEIAEECGNLPLALAMVGAMVRGRPDRWANALHRLRSADLGKIRQQFPDYPYPDLLRAIQVSVQALEPEVQARYLGLAVFPEDTPIPQATLQTFWAPEGLDEYDVQDVLDALVDRSLARRDETDCLTLHDLQYDYVRQQTDDLPALHQRLLRAYAARCPAGWPSGTDDGYYFQHLADHLMQAGRANELRELLLDLHWLQAKLETTGAAVLIADYELLSGDAELRLVQGAIRLSAHVLAQDKAQLWSQLYGRLMAHDAPAIQAMLALWPETPWLRSLVPSLTPPGGPLLRTLTGHTSAVNAVAVTPDGRRVVSASDDRTLKVWDLERGEELRTILTGHTDKVNAVAVTPDGRRAVSASLDRTLKVWELERGQELRTLTGHTDDVNAIAVTPDGRRVVSASSDQTLKVWDLERDEALRILTGHTDRVDAVAVTPDGRRAISASYRTLKVRDISPELNTSLERGEALRTLTGHTNRVMSVTVTPDGRRAVSASLDKTLKVWDLERGEALRTLTGHTSAVFAVAVTPDGRRAVSASWDETLKVWDLERGDALHTLKGHSYWVNAVAVTADGRRAVSASDDRTLKVWDLERGEELRTLTGHTALVWSVAVTPDGQRAVSASDDRTLKVWDISPELNTSLERGEELHTLTGHSYWVNAVAVTPDGRRAVSASWDETLKVWDLERGEALHTLTGHTWVAFAVAVTPDGRRAVSASDNGTLIVWDLERGEELRTLMGHWGSVNAVAVTPDGQRAVSVSTDRTLKVWDLERGQELRTLTGHTDRVDAVAVTPDGRRAVSASSDHTLKVWDLESGKLVATFRGESVLTACAVALDGTFVAGEQSGQMHFLRLEGA